MSEENIQIKKVSVKDGKPSFAYDKEDPVSKKWFPVGGESHPDDPIHADFQTALNNLRIHLAILSVAVRPHGSITINTPAIYLESESDNAYQFLDDLKEKIERVEAEAIAYLKGEKRGSDPQQALNFESNGNEKSGPVAEEVTEEATA
jgi:hypothetical protein